MSNQIIHKISIDDPQYPRLLRKIDDPPKILYVRGRLDLNSRPVLAVVGTRRYSDYGKRVALEIVGQLAEMSFIIVSGMALGIDTFAHKAALEKGAKTIAVLGTGIDRASVYPKENLGLSEKIVESGALVSEYPPKSPSYKSNFPQRNRIIAGLSLGVLVVEAPLRSGALITARHAREQKRKVFAVPGSIYSSNSKGCHFLIKNGAKLVDSVEDILNELGISKKFAKKEVKGKTREEELILSVLKNKARHIDEIIEITELSPAKVMSILASLEAEEKVRNLGGNIFTIAS